MKKILVILAILSVFLAACDSQQAQQTTQDTQAMEDQTQEVLEESAEITQETQAAESSMLNLAKALEMGQSVKCTTTFDGQTSTTYWKNERMRMDTPSVDAHGIYTEDVMYTWTGKQGVMMKLEDIQQMANNAQSQAQPAPKTKEEIMNENVDVQCEPFSVPESMFTPPSDVEFQDMSEIFKQLEGMNIDIPQMPQ